MYGYIYKTTNLINGKFYIGKHKSEKYDPSYYGSGKIIRLAIKKYGLENFKNEVLEQFDSLDELNEAEKQYIDKYRKLDKSRLYNIADGGDGGDTFSSKSEEEKLKFKNKMTKINKERCNTEEFKKRISQCSKERYASVEVRKKQSEVTRKTQSDETLRKEQSDRLKTYFKEHPKDNSFLYIPCSITLNGETTYFNSVKELKNYLKDVLKQSPSNPVIHKMLETELPYRAFHKKQSYLNGLVMKKYNKCKNVETMSDECSSVGSETGTDSKCKTP